MSEISAFLTIDLQEESEWVLLKPDMFNIKWYSFLLDSQDPGLDGTMSFLPLTARSMRSSGREEKYYFAIPPLMP